MQIIIIIIIIIHFCIFIIIIFFFGGVMSSLAKAIFFKLFIIMYLGSILVQLAPVT